ncbi:SIMPL domain-containing protein [Roseibium aggregatum]|nr:SIMPL domain-containing protein [Roseibium aggregatum]
MSQIIRLSTMPRRAPERSRVLSAMLLAMTIAIVSPSPAAKAAEKPATISLEGRGEISVAPDMAVVTTRVVNVGASAPEALQANTAAIAKVIADIKAAGIEAKDIQTSGFSIYPRYENRKDGNNEPPKIVGYEVSNGVTVRVRALEKLGAILNAVVASGANSVDGISFAVSDTSEKLDEARKEAVADARRKAEIYADAAGVKLGRILSISEGSVAMPRPYAVRSEKMMAMAAAPVPVEAGEETLSATVSIVWEIAE